MKTIPQKVRRVECKGASRAAYLRSGLPVEAGLQMCGQAC